MLSVSASARPLAMLRISLVFLTSSSKHKNGTSFILQLQPSFLALALDGGEWSASCPSRFTHVETAPEYVEKNLDLLRIENIQMSTIKNHHGLPILDYPFFNYL
jgi:hypothetical protein